MVVEIETIRLVYVEQFGDAGHADAVERTAALTGQPVEVIEAVVAEEAVA